MNACLDMSPFKFLVIGYEVLDCGTDALGLEAINIRGSNGTVQIWIFRKRFKSTTTER